MPQYFADNGIGCEGIGLLAELLGKLTSLQELYLQGVFGLFGIDDVVPGIVVLGGMMHDVGLCSSVTMQEMRSIWKEQYCLRSRSTG